MHKNVWLIILTSAIVACSNLPPVPHHVQYGVHADVNPPGFYGIDNETEAQMYRPFTDPAMKGGQCLSADDYKSFQAWIDAIKQEAQNRCQ